MEKSQTIASGKAVLIETLWNVKSGIRAVITSSAVVLIETLWNVKDVQVRNGK